MYCLLTDCLCLRNAYLWVNLEGKIILHFVFITSFFWTYKIYRSNFCNIGSSYLILAGGRENLVGDAWKNVQLTLSTWKNSTHLSAWKNSTSLKCSLYQTLTYIFMYKHSVHTCIVHNPSSFCILLTFMDSISKCITHVNGVNRDCSLIAGWVASSSL